MDLITVPREEWQMMQDMVHDIYSMLKAKPSRKEWVRMEDFMKETGKKRHQVDHICKEHPELKRNRKGEGVQINLKKYNELYN